MEYVCPTWAILVLREYFSQSALAGYYLLLKKPGIILPAVVTGLFIYSIMLRQSGFTYS